MSSEGVKKLLARAAEEPTFRARLESDPASVLDQDSTLGTEEKASLKALPVSVLSAMVDAATTPARATASMKPTFKEWGAMGLTVVLVLIFIPVLVKTLGAIDTDPHGVAIGGATQLVDPFAKSKDLLSIVLPLLGAAITFWLGVAIEGKRADTNGKAADDAKQDSKEAKDRESETRTTAAEALGRVHGALESVGGADSGGVERRGVGAQGPDLAALKNLVADARDRVMG